MLVLHFNSGRESAEPCPVAAAPCGRPQMGYTASTRGGMQWDPFFPPASTAGLSLEFEVHFDLQPFRLTRGLPYARLIAEFLSS